MFPQTQSIKSIFMVSELLLIIFPFLKKICEYDLSLIFGIWNTFMEYPGMPCGISVGRGKCLWSSRKPVFSLIWVLYEQDRFKRHKGKTWNVITHVRGIWTSVQPLSLLYRSIYFLISTTLRHLDIVGFKVKSPLKNRNCACQLPVLVVDMATILIFQTGGKAVKSR